VQHTANADRETTLETLFPTETLHPAGDCENTQVQHTARSLSVRTGVSRGVSVKRSHLTISSVSVGSEQSFWGKTVFLREESSVSVERSVSVGKGTNRDLTACRYTDTYANTHTHAHMHILVCTHSHMFIHTHTALDVHVKQMVCSYMYMYIYTYTYTCLYL